MPFRMKVSLADARIPSADYVRMPVHDLPAPPNTSHVLRSSHAAPST